MFAGRESWLHLGNYFFYVKIALLLTMKACDLADIGMCLFPLPSNELMFYNGGKLCGDFFDVVFGRLLFFIILLNEEVKLKVYIFCLKSKSYNRDNKFCSLIF